jgi:hypothetical protein
MTLWSQAGHGNTARHSASHRSDVPDFGFP